MTDSCRQFHTGEDLRDLSGEHRPPDNTSISINLNKHQPDGYPNQHLLLVPLVTLQHVGPSHLSLYWGNAGVQCLSPVTMGVSRV